MAGKALEIAVYGKGGIGKSTLSANLSAALSSRGQRVLQIGCDPKHDSTRLLMHGKEQKTVLDYLRETDKEQQRLPEVLSDGFAGVGCVEAGGPQPGIGCAGRGIISAFEFLDRLKAKTDYDLVLYDVLGDVVCGGFAVPVRREYADVIFLVTSGEYMALYAANNILRGIRTFDGDRYCRVAGILYNERKVPEEDLRVHRFAEAVHLPVLAKIPRDPRFADAEHECRTVMEMAETEDRYRSLAEVFRGLAEGVTEQMQLYPAKPLGDEELEDAVLRGKMPENAGNACDTGNVEITEDNSKTEVVGDTGDSGNSGAAFENAESLDTGNAGSLRRHKPPLYGCAFNGAASVAVHINDALVIAHAPKACAFYTWQNISSPGRRNLFQRGILVPSALDPNFACTDITHAEAVFGGLERLREKVQEALDAGWKSVIILSSCVSGIIGDDIRQLENMSTSSQQVIAVHTDGDIAGDYMEGIRMCVRRLAEALIDPSVKPSGRRINLLHETGINVNKERNFRILEDMLKALDISVHCRFPGDALTEQVRTMAAAPLNVLAVEDEDGQKMRQWLTEEYGLTFMEEPLPVGVPATARWLRKIAAFFDHGDTGRAEILIRKEEEKYRREIDRLKPILAGKSIFITTINANIDWLLSVLTDLGMDIRKIAVMNYLRTEIHVSDTPEKYPIDPEFPWQNLLECIQREDPDLVLSNYVTQIPGCHAVFDAIPMSPVTGFDAGLAAARRWAELMEKQREGGWRRDRELYEKYYS